MVWFIYFVRCKDNSLYCGITNSLEKRIKAHNDGKGAKYIVPSRRPVVLAYFEAKKTKSEALKREIALKRLNKKSKEKLIAGK